MMNTHRPPVLFYRLPAYWALISPKRAYAFLKLFVEEDTIRLKGYSAFPLGRAFSSARHTLTFIGTINTITILDFARFYVEYLPANGAYIFYLSIPTDIITFLRTINTPPILDFARDYVKHLTADFAYSFYLSSSSNTHTFS